MANNSPENIPAEVEALLARTELVNALEALTSEIRPTALLNRTGTAFKTSATDAAAVLQGKKAEIPTAARQKKATKFLVAAGVLVGVVGLAVVKAVRKK